jgi:hypothetical protein
VVLWASLHSTAAESPKQQLRPLSTPSLLGRQISAEGLLATLQPACHMAGLRLKKLNFSMSEVFIAAFFF